jgi:hypothetical protein
MTMQKERVRAKGTRVEDSGRSKSVLPHDDGLASDEK